MPMQDMKCSVSSEKSSGYVMQIICKNLFISSGLHFLFRFVRPFLILFINIYYPQKIFMPICCYMPNKFHNSLEFPHDYSVHPKGGNC
jgi:hypothetical protein